MKIIHLFSNWKWTGPAEPAVNLCQALAGRHEVALICGSPPEEGAPNAVFEKSLERGVTPLEGFRLRKHFRLWDNLMDWVKLRNTFREGCFDLVHVHLQNDHLLAGFARRGLEEMPPIVRTFYGAEGPDPTLRAGFLLRRFTDGAVAVSEAGQRRIISAYDFPEDRTATIPAAVNTHRFDPGRFDRDAARAAQGLGPGDFVLGIVARMQRHRKFEVLLEAMQLAMQEAPNLNLLIVGRGTHRETVAMEPVRDMGLADRILFTGYLDGDAFVQALAAMDAAIFLVPGSDGSCRAVREKMAMGLPVIATNIPPLDEMIIPGETGLLIEPTVEGIRDAAIRLVRRKEDAARMGQNARARAVKEYSLERQADRIEAFYHRILSEEGGERRKGLKTDRRVP